MKFIVEVGMPHEPFSTLVREGTAGQKIGKILEGIKPEAVYFTDNDVGRGIIMIVDIEDYSQLPHVTEPLMLTFNASVHYRIAMGLDELAEADLERYTTT